MVLVRPVIRIIVRRDERIPFTHGTIVSAGHIGIVIAGHHRGIEWIADAAQPFACQPDLDGRCEIDKIAGDHQMVRLFRADIAQQEIQCIHKQMLAPVAVPVDKAGDAFRGQFAHSQARKRAEVNI